MVTMAEKDLAELQTENYGQLKNLFESVKGKFTQALEVDTKGSDKTWKDMTLYKGEEFYKYSQEFLAYVDPAFIQDMRDNKEWYDENANEFLLNINYPCKL